MHNKKANSFQGSKLSMMLKMLSEEEQKLLGKWLGSSWCNSNKKLVQLYKLLTKNRRKLLEGTLGKEKICTLMFPEKPYDKSRKELNNLIMKLVKQIESFLVHQSVAGDDVKEKMLLRMEYLRRGQRDRFQEISMDLLGGLEKKERKDWDDYLSLTLVQEAAYFEQSSTSRHQSSPQHLFLRINCSIRP